MTTKYNTNIFDSIKDALSTKEVENKFQDFLKFKPDNTYIVRLVPNVQDGKRTRFRYYQHVWKSVVNQKLINVTCPHTVEEKCPIDDYRYKIHLSKDEVLKKKADPLYRKEMWLYNVYVIKDPTNPDNQGKVKILNAGSQLQKIIENAINGDDADEFGYRIFDFTENGCNLRIKVETGKSGLPDYTSSKFTSPSEIEGIEHPDEVYSQFKPLDTIFQIKSYDEIKSLLDVHFFGKDETESVNEKVVNDDIEDETPIVESPKASSSSEHDDKIKSILADL